MNEKFKDTDLREALRRNYANVPEMPVSSFTTKKRATRSPLLGATGVCRESTECAFGPIKGSESPLAKVSGVGVRLLAFSIAASILIAFLLWPKGEKAPITQPEIQQPVVAEVIESESPQPVPEPVPEPVLAQAKPQEKPKARVVRTAEPVAIVKQEEKPEVLEENLLAEIQNTPLATREELGESPVELPVLPPERQALVDMFLAEEALQVAYMQQEQTKALRAFTAGLEGKEPETSHLITSF